MQYSKVHSLEKLLKKNVDEVSGEDSKKLWNHHV